MNRKIHFKENLITYWPDQFWVYSTGGNSSARAPRSHVATTRTIFDGKSVKEEKGPWKSWKCVNKSQIVEISWQHNNNDLIISQLRWYLLKVVCCRSRDLPVLNRAGRDMSRLWHCVHGTRNNCFILPGSRGFWASGANRLQRPPPSAHRGSAAFYKSESLTQRIPRSIEALSYYCTSNHSLVLNQGNGKEDKVYTTFISPKTA